MHRHRDERSAYLPVHDRSRTPHGNAATVVIKITGNADTYKRLGEEMIDFDASPVITEGKPMKEAAKELYDLMMEVANGKKTKAEILEDFSWVTPPFGKI